MKQNRIGSLDKFALHYEEMLPRKIKTRKGGKGHTMSKQAKAETPAKTYNKTKSEHAKDILIAMLITAIAAFIGGMQFESKQAAEVRSAAAQVTAAPAAVKK